MNFKVVKSSGVTSSATLWFLGWGFDDSIEPFLSGDGDIIIIWDYTSLSLTLDLSQWSEFTVKAWSMGVWAAEAFMDMNPGLRIVRAEAYCGTSKPADPVCGIGAEAIRLTIDNWNEVNRRKFARKICVDARLASTVEPLLVCRSAESQKDELEAILSAQSADSSVVHWNLAVVSLRDRIFPVAAQRAWWQGRADVVEERDIPHWPFAQTGAGE